MSNQTKIKKLTAETTQINNLEKNLVDSIKALEQYVTERSTSQKTIAFAASSRLVQVCTTFAAALAPPSGPACRALSEPFQRYIQPTLLHIQKHQ
jgi:hypothetical protein